VHVVIKIPLAIRLRMTALAATSETNPARPSRLAVLDVSDKLPAPGASAAMESPGHALTGIVNADFAGPTESRIPRPALDHLAADRNEFFRIGPSGLDRIETIPRHALDFAHFLISRKFELPFTYRPKRVGLEIKSA
jgi:hypothetical protein